MYTLRNTSYLLRAVCLGQSLGTSRGTPLLVMLMMDGETVMTPCCHFHCNSRNMPKKYFAAYLTFKCTIFHIN